MLQYFISFNQLKRTAFRNPPTQNVRKKYKTIFIVLQLIKCILVLFNEKLLCSIVAFNDLIVRVFQCDLISGDSKMIFSLVYFKFEKCFFIKIKHIL